MSARVIDGRALATGLRVKYAESVAELARDGIVPGLAVIVVGSDSASHLYVRNKIRACDECGVRSFLHSLYTDATEAEVLDLIGKLNVDPSVHGILVQLPLPLQIDVRRVLETIAVDKDVDGFHLYNVGALTVGRSEERRV